MLREALDVWRLHADGMPLKPQLRLRSAVIQSFEFSYGRRGSAADAS